MLPRFAEVITTPIVDNWAEVIKNPAVAAQSGLITGAYVLAVLATRSLRRIESSAVQTKLIEGGHYEGVPLSRPKVRAFLLNHRVYSRLSTDDDCVWLLRSLEGACADIANATEPIQTAWSQAFIYLVSAKTIPLSIRKASCEMIAKLYSLNPAFMSVAMISGLWQWVESSEKNEKDSVAASAKFETSHLHLVLRSITPSHEDLEALGIQRSQDSIERQMCALLVLARKELVPRCSWIDLCLRVGVDPGGPGTQVRTGANRPIDQEGTIRRKRETPRSSTLCQMALTNIKSSIINAAACNAAADLAFVAPEIMIPRIIDLLRADLATNELGEIGPVEAAIFRTPEGTTFVDVLAKKSQIVPNKNTKDYDTLKWEEDLRSQLAQKKGLQKKLTSEEQAKVNAQLKRKPKFAVQYSKWQRDSCVVSVSFRVWCLVHRQMRVAGLVPLLPFS